MKSIQCPLIEALADKVYMIEEIDLSDKSKEQLRRLGCAVGEPFHVVSQCHNCTVVTFDDVQFAIDDVLGKKIIVKETLE
jgi:Fe2+ transport system protein FeoA